jgi:hypothetical protein
MEDNIWEYPFGDLDDDDDFFYRLPEEIGITHHRITNFRHLKSNSIIT